MTASINGTTGVTFPDASVQATAATGFGFKNRIINGDFRIDQRNAGASVTTSTAAAWTYFLDRWSYFCTSATKFSIQQNAGSVTLPVGFSNYLGATSSAATTVGSNDVYSIRQVIEGFNVSDLAWGTANAKPVTLSFLVYSSLTGTFGGALQNGGSNRSYPFSYTVSSANTWTPVSVTIAGDTAGTWLTNSSGGVSVYFNLGTGSTFSTTAGAWAAGNYISATGATSVVGTNGATFYITGVQLEKGSTATSFDYRPYGTELALCQRYYWSVAVVATQAVESVSTTIGAPITQPIASLPVMRSQPTTSAPSVQSSAGMTLNSPSVTAGSNPSVLTLSGSYNLAVGNRAYVIFNNGNFTASAEL